MDTVARVQLKRALFPPAPEEHSRPWVVVLAHWLYMLDGGAKIAAIAITLTFRVLGSRLVPELGPFVAGMTLTALLAAVEIWAAWLIWRGPGWVVGSCSAWAS